MDDTAKDQHPQLFALLQERLSGLGLDQDTYGPYVLGVADIGGNIDADELGDVVQLLQASSESHGDDDSVWEQLTQDIVSKMTLDADYRTQQQHQNVQQKKADLEEQLQQAKLEEQQQVPKETLASNSGSGVDDAAKQAMLQRFAYENDDADGQNNDNDDDAPKNNRQVAAEANLEAAKEAKSKKVETKKEAQQKTKEQRLNKDKMKEERRKKTGKLERKR
jgi:hypothetical protein